MLIEVGAVHLLDRLSTTQFLGLLHDAVLGDWRKIHELIYITLPQDEATVLTVGVRNHDWNREPMNIAER
jgi:hypothetical protein